MNTFNFIRFLNNNIQTVIQISATAAVLWRVENTKQVLSKKVVKLKQSMAEKINDLETASSTLKQSVLDKISSLETANGKINMKLETIESNTKTALLEHMNKIKSTTKDLTIDKITSSEVPSLHSIPEIHDPTKFTVIHQSHFNYWPYVGGAVLIVLAAVVIYYKLPNFFDIKSNIQDLIHQLPGSNSARGVEHIDQLGLTIKTFVTHGKAHSTYCHSLSGKEFNSFVDYLQFLNTNAAVAASTEVLPITNVITSTGLDITGLI